MLSPSCLEELRTRWFPHLTDSALDRLIELLETQSPLLIHGSFTWVVPMGCLASHAGWHHPKTEHLHEEAGICWLTKVAGLNPATSQVIREWDSHSTDDWGFRAELLGVMREERETRAVRKQTQQSEVTTYRSTNSPSVLTPA
jgi:hypothetical protein